MRLSRGLAWTSGFFVLAVGGQLASCATLESIPTGVCGNDVKEGKEDCDGVAPADRFDGGVGVCGSTGLGACRFLCGQHVDSDGASALTVCPTNEVCSLEDSICRADPGSADAPTYTFAQLGPPIPGDARALTAGDFDGDGRDDVISLSTAETKLYLGSTKGLTLAFDSDLLMSGARAAKLTGAPYAPDVHASYAPMKGQDPTMDLTFLLDQGIAVVTGQSNGTLTPAAYPKVDVPNDIVFAGITYGAALGMKAAPTPWLFIPYIKGQDVLGGVGCADGQLSLAYAATPPVSVHCFDQTPGNVSHVVSALLVSDVNAVCPQFIFAFKGDTKMTVYSPCEPLKPVFTPWKNTLPDQTVFNIALDVGTISWGPFVTDVDGDGFLDLVAGAKVGGVEKIFVAFSDGALNFHGKSGRISIAEEYRTEVAPWEVYPRPDQIDSQVLAVGDINGDHRPDILTTKGLFVSSSVMSPDADGVYYEVYGASVATKGGVFESGAFGDFNGDGLGDVAIALEVQTGTAAVGVPEVITLLGSSKHVDAIPLLDPYLVPTDAPTFHVVSGDFNGDGIDDIAFGQTTDPGLHLETPPRPGTIDTITVIYGDRGGNFSPVSMGQVQGISSLVTADILGANVPLYDGDSDLGVLFSFTDDQGHGHHDAAILGGRPGHLLIAPLGLDAIVDGASLRQAQPLAVASGRFQSPDHYDLGALAVGIDSSGLALDELQLWRTPLEGGAFAEASSYVALSKGLSTLAAKPSDVIASATTYPIGGGTTDWLIALATSIPTSLISMPTARIYLGEPTAGGAFSAQELDFQPPIPERGFGPHARVEATDLGDGPVIVVLVNGRLYLISKPTSSLVPNPIEMSGVVDFAILHRPASDKSLLVYVTDKGAVYTSDGEHPKAAKGIDPTTAPLSIAVGDLDGDRLPDIVIGSAENLTVYRMVAP